MVEYRRNVDWLIEPLSTRGWRLLNIAKLFTLIPKDKSFLGRVLDLGCGYGDLPRYLQGVYNSYKGLDLDTRAIAIARERTPELEWEGINIETLESLYFDTFDTIFLLDVLEHLEEPEALLEKIGKQFEGILLLTTPNRWFSREENPYHLKEFTKRELTKALKYNKTYHILEEGPQLFARVIY